MKKITAALLLTALFTASCSQNNKVNVGRLVDNYAEVTIPAPDLTGITDNGKEVLKLYRKAADEVDKIYWHQYFGDGKTFLESLSDPSERLYAEINYGPWDRIDGKPFIQGFGSKPSGARFWAVKSKRGMVTFSPLSKPFRQLRSSGTSRAERASRSGSPSFSRGRASRSR